MAIKLRPPTEADTQAIGDIIYRAFAGIAQQHSFPLDFTSPQMANGVAQMLLAPGSGLYGVVAEENGKVIGSNFLDERDAIKGVGPITVDPDVQSRGVGRQLMEAVLQRARSQNAVGVRLVQEAYNCVSMSLYASLGFDVKEPLVLINGVPKSTTDSGQNLKGVRLMTENDLPQCAALCKTVHGFDRSGELRGTLQGKMFRPYVLERSGRITAYASAPEFFVLNHGVAETAEDMYQVLIGACAANDRKPLSILVPIRDTAFFRWCLSEGLRTIKPLTLMSIGEYQEPAGPFFPSVAY